MGLLARRPASLQLLLWSSPGRKALGVPSIILSPDHLKVGRAWRDLLVAFTAPSDLLKQQEDPEDHELGPKAGK